MADEPMDAPGGGYVDDDLDLDDDDDVVMEAGPSSAPGPSKSARLKPANDPRDYALKVESDRERETIIGRFLSGCPDLSPPARMRMLRTGEESAEGRLEAIEENARQVRYRTSTVARRRREIKEKQGYTTMPDRDRKRWRMEIVDEDDVDHTAAVANDKKVVGEGAISYFEKMPEATRLFEGNFDGRSKSRYGVLVVDEGTRTATLTPVGPYGWFSFRQKRGRRVADGVKKESKMSTEVAEKMMAKKEEKKIKKLAKYHVMGQVAQEAAEFTAGSSAGVLAKKENSSIGMRRGKERKEVRAAPREGMDYNEEFADDDVALVEKEEQEEEVDMVERGKKYKKEWEKMLKGEDVEVPKEGSGSQPGSPSGSESGSERRGPAGLSSPSRRSRPASPEGQGLPPRGPSAGNANLSSAAGRRGSTGASGSRPASERVSPGRGTPSVGSGSAPGTPLREAYAHLLPANGAAPTEQHVVAILRAMITNRATESVPLKDFSQLFHGSPHKKVLMQILKRVAKLSEQRPGSKVYYVALLPGN